MNLDICIEMVLTEYPFEERIVRAADLGFNNVEMWFTDASYQGSPVDLARLAEQHGVTITNTVIGAPDGSTGGGLTNPGNRDQWLDRARATLEFNRAAGIPATIVCTGNVQEGLSDSEMMDSIIEGLKPTVEMAEKAGITLLLEALNSTRDHPDYFLTSSDLGATICRTLKSERMRLLFDCYHMQIMEGDLVTHIERNLDVIGHFHAAGVPGRREVFLGEVNYRYVFDRIETLGYRGLFGLEYTPSMNSAFSLQNTLDYLKTA